MRKLSLPGVVVAVAVLGAATSASADRARSWRFVGMHPIVSEYGGGFCYIEVPHVHVYRPYRPDVLYRDDDEGYHFVGDPVPYGYEGPKHAYYGHHPVVEYGHHDEFCYLEGPHYHPYDVEAGAQFTLRSGVHFYTGTLPRVYVEARPRFAKINAVYRPLEYSRPVVVDSPPPEYRGPVFVEEPTVVVPAHVGVGAGVHAEAGVGFHAGVSIGVPLPIVEVRPAPVVVHEVHPTVIVHDRPVRVIRVKDRGHGHRGKGKWKWDD